MDLAGFQHGIALFNRREFFDAHEVLEDVWRAAPHEEKKFLQGLIQVAVALHHHSRGNLVGALSLMRRAHRNLSRYPVNFSGMDLPALLESMRAWEHALAGEASAPAWPQMILRS